MPVPCDDLIFRSSYLRIDPNERAVCVEDGDFVSRYGVAPALDAPATPSPPGVRGSPENCTTDAPRIIRIRENPRFLGGFHGGDGGI